MRSVAQLARLGTAAALLLAGCATLPPPPALSWHERRSTLQHLEGFALQGRVAVAAGEEGFSAALSWSQRAERSSVDLRGPAGFGAAHIEQSGAELLFTTSKGLKLGNAEAASALQRELGFELPLGSLRYWVLGVDDPAFPVEDEGLDGEERLAHLLQQRWSVEYPEYQRSGGTRRPQWLPRRITLRHEAVRVRLLIQAWQLP
jgi:outer membrane lipoprotein LolB